jgi:hypothetical protein
MAAGTRIVYAPSGYQLNGESPMSLASMNLGERIVLVTRLAIEAHLQKIVEEERCIERRDTTGGAGHSQVKDDPTPLAEGEVE